MSHDPNHHDDIDALAHAANQSHPPTTTARRICPACGSRRYTQGHIRADIHSSNTFITAADLRKSAFNAPNYQLKTAACLDCGLIRQFIASKDLKKLQNT